MPLVETLTEKEFDSCRLLLQSYPFKPYGYYAEKIEAARVENHFLMGIQASIQKGERGLYLPGPEGAVGMALWNRLAWDSDRFGFSAGRLIWLMALGNYDEQYERKERLLKSVLKESSKEGIRHLSARLHSSDLSGIHLLEKYGFLTVDSILTYAVRIQEVGRPSIPERVEVRLFRPKELNSLREIARSSFIYDRFHSDPRISPKVADDLHATWVENSCLGNAADAVVVAAEQDRVLGLATCKIERQTTQHLKFSIGTIGLVATRREDRRRGLAESITFGALGWFRDQGADIVEVGTQMRNIPASRLYEKCGFRLVSSSLSLRKWVEE